MNLIPLQLLTIIASMLMIIPAVILIRILVWAIGEILWWARRRRSPQSENQREHETPSPIRTETGHD